MRFTAIIFAALMLAWAGAFPGQAVADTLSGSLVEVLHEQGVLSDEAYDGLVRTGQSKGDTAMGAQLIEILHDQGSINDEAYGKLKAKADEEAKAPDTVTAVAKSSPAPEGGAAGQAAPAGPADRPFDKALASVEEGFARLGGDHVKLKIGSWTQIGWVSDDSGSSTYFPGVSRAAASGSANQFFVRFARLYFNGKLSEKIGFRVMFDAAPTSGNVLRDAFIYADYIPYARITLGQFLTPFGDELWRAPFDVPTINYSMASTFSQLGVSRDLGLMLSGKYAHPGKPLGAGYAVALINGSGANANDDNDHKDVIGRVWVNPFVEGLSVGGSFYVGKNSVGGMDRDRSRWAAEFDYEPAYAKGLSLRGEYMWDRRYFGTYASALADPLPAFGRHTHADGWYVTAAYRINGLDGFWGNFNDLEPVVRYERFDEDAAVADNERTRTTVGFNYYLNKYIRLMANYEFIRADGSLAARSLQAIDNVDHDVFMTNLQIWF